MEEARFDPGKEETVPKWQTVKLQMGGMINSRKCDTGRRRNGGGAKRRQQTDRQDGAADH